MATSKDYLNFILDRFSGLDGITYRSMMGEYIIYYKEKIAAYVCDNRLLVKILHSTTMLLPDAPHEPPYPDAKDMILVENVDSREFLEILFRTMESELTVPKSKKRKEMHHGI